MKEFCFITPPYDEDLSSIINFYSEQSYCDFLDESEITELINDGFEVIR